MKTALLIVGALCFIASGVMFVVGSNSSHMSELKDFFWTPLPLGALLVIGGALKKDK